MKRLIAIAVSLLALHAQAGVIIDDSISGAVTNTFEGQTPGPKMGIIGALGAAYGEYFLGQTVTPTGSFDVISGSPSPLMALQSNANTPDNIGILLYNGTNVIYGDLNGQVGEGALSVALASGSDVFGLNVVGANAGQFIVQFFGADGSVLGSITQIASDRFFGFRATGGDLIYGVSITNSDAAGIAYDNVTFNQNASDVPEPASLALFGLGALGLAAARRRKQ